MSWFRLGTLAIGSLSSTVLLAVITAYLLVLRKKPKDAKYLTGYLCALLVLLLSYTARYSMFTSAGLATSQISNLIVFGVVSLVQFAYHYGSCLHPKEARVVLVGSLALAAVIWISLFFEDAPSLYDFRAQFFSNVFSPKVGIFVLVNYLWAFSVFVRKIITYAKSETTKRLSRSARSFSYLCIAYALLSVLYLLFQLDMMTRELYTLIFNTGSLLICLLIFIVYVNNASHPVSIIVKLVGIPLAVVMVAFGVASSALMPLVHSTLGDRYRDDVSLTQLVLDSGWSGQVPPSIAFVLPDNPRRLAYRAEDIRDEWAGHIIDSSASWQEGLIPERSGLKPSFIYLDLYDTNSFFLCYTITSRSTSYKIGFRYLRYRFDVHRFNVRLLLAVGIGTVIILMLFPIAFRRGLFTPLASLLSAVEQVSSGNYRIRLPVLIEDELGQLTKGFNAMIASLKDAEGNFQALAENANDAILIISTDGRFLYANQRAEEIVGFSLQELTGKHFSEVLSPEETRQITPVISERLSAGFKAYETNIVGADGGVVPVEVSGAKTGWQGHEAGVLVIRDISERKQAEEAIQAQQVKLHRTDKLASIGALVAGMAHEINNPNQAIAHNASFLAEGMKTLLSLYEETADNSIRVAGMEITEYRDSAIDAVDDIKAGTDRIDHIVQELKRLVSGGSSSTIESMEVNEVVRVVVDLSRHMINRATQHFTLKLAPDLPHVMADRIGLEQVVLNLLQNACQALPSRERGISIRTESADGHVFIEVSDEGTGIPEQQLPNITDSFFTTKTESGGTGLGLSVSLRILKEIGGRITFDSKVDFGTTVKVTFPSL